YAPEREVDAGHRSAQEQISTGADQHRSRSAQKQISTRTTDQHRGVLMDRRNFFRTSGAAAGVGFTALVAQGTASAAPEQTERDPIVADPPDGALVITDGTLRVRLHPDFPQVVDYQLDGATLAGRYGPAHTTVTIDDVAYDVEVTAPQVTDDSSATYHLTVPDLPGVEFDAE